MRRILALLVLLAGFAFAEDKIDLASLPAEKFLALIREPLRENAWGEFTGSIQHKSTSRRLKGILRVRITFTPEAMLAQIVLNDTNVYSLEQSHKKGEKVTLSLERPEVEKEPGLFVFGVEPSDLTFSFIYWELERELPTENGKSGLCRVMKLKEPGGKRTALVWFNVKYGFPEKAAWFAEGNSTTPVRRLELKGAKRHENGLWFVREMKLEGDGWKSMVTFDHVSFNDIGK